mgnify:CR=1 FL=1|jgi:hypothetical protein
MNLEDFKTVKPHPSKSVFKGYSRAKIAYHLEIHPCYWGAILNGNVKPGAELAARITKLADEFKQAAGNKVSS